MTKLKAPKLRIDSNSLLAAWQFFRALPAGKMAFSKLLGVMVPYSGSIGAQVESITPGHAVISLSDRRGVRNHLRSVHAMALANLGELSTGLAVITAIPGNAQGIVTRFSVTYLKKARGKLIAECECERILSNHTQEFEVLGIIRNAAQEEVARVQAMWRIGPRS